MPKHTYIATLPDGTPFTRTTERTYTHVIAVRDAKGWGVTGCVGRANLANAKVREAGRVVRDLLEACAIPLTIAPKAAKPQANKTLPLDWEPALGVDYDSQVSRREMDLPHNLPTSWHTHAPMGDDD